MYEKGHPLVNYLALLYEWMDEWMNEWMNDIY
jgi:hypothetical protein